MVAELKSCAVMGITGHIVTVETDYFDSIPDFQIVGLGDTAIKESKERVKSALKNSGIKLPAKGFVANLAPADMKKEGAFYDLPIAIGLALSCKILHNVDIKDCMFIGELALSGEIRPVKGILPSVIAAKENNITKIFVPEKNKKEAAVVEGVEIFPCTNLSSVFEHISGAKLIIPYKNSNEEVLKTGGEYPLDFSDVKGQKMAKWALEVAAAGGHNVLIV